MTATPSVAVLIEVQQRAPKDEAERSSRRISFSRTGQVFTTGLSAPKGHCFTPCPKRTNSKAEGARCNCGTLTTSFESFIVISLQIKTSSQWP